MAIGRNGACSCWWLCWLCCPHIVSFIESCKLDYHTRLLTKLNWLFTYLSPLAWRPDDDEVEDVSFQLENTHLDELKGATAHTIFYEKLEELLKLKISSICRGFMTATPREVGSALVVSYRCICGASGRWESQPQVGGKFVGNLLTATSTFFRYIPKHLWAFTLRSSCKVNMSRIGRELAGNNSLSVKQQTIHIY